jgi:hypothetical protein
MSHPFAWPRWRLPARLLAVLLLAAASAARAEWPVRVEAAALGFSVPPGWPTEPEPENDTPPAMNAAQPLFLRWTRAPLEPAALPAATPSMPASSAPARAPARRAGAPAAAAEAAPLPPPTVRMAVFYTAPSLSLVFASAQFMKARGWPIDPPDGAVLKAADGLTNDRAVGYRTAYVERGLPMRAYVVYTFRESQITETVFAAPAVHWPQVEPEYRMMISTLALDP